MSLGRQPWRIRIQRFIAYEFIDFEINYYTNQMKDGFSK